MAEAPLGFQLHALVAFALFALWPFTRLVHVFSAPLGYLTRPYIVYRSRDDRSSAAPAAPRLGTGRPEMCEHCGCRGVEPIRNLMDEHVALLDGAHAVRQAIGAGDRARRPRCSRSSSPGSSGTYPRGEGRVQRAARQGEFLDEVDALEQEHQTFDQAIASIDPDAADFDSRVDGAVPRARGARRARGPRDLPGLGRHPRCHRLGDGPAGPPRHPHLPRRQLTGAPPPVCEGGDVEGRRDRFEEIAPTLIEPVRRFLARRTDPDTAEDVLAETLLVCWRRAEELPDLPLPWVYAVARNCLHNAERSARRQERLAARIASVDPPQPTAPAPEDADAGARRWPRCGRRRPSCSGCGRGSS